MAPRETESNAYAKCWSDQQRALWSIMVFSVVVNTLCGIMILPPRQPRFFARLPRWPLKRIVTVLFYISFKRLWQGRLYRGRGVMNFRLPDHVD